MFRISHEGAGIGEADTIKGAREIVGAQPPGRYKDFLTKVWT